MHPINNQYGKLGDLPKLRYLFMTPEQLAANGTEAGHQKALFAWAALSGYPELKWMFHIQNASANRSAKVVGVKAGVPDIHLPISKGGYKGLWIELKVGKNKASDKQNEWIDFLRSQGYIVGICYGWEEARDYIIRYIEMK